MNGAVRIGGHCAPAIAALLVAASAAASEPDPNPQQLDALTNARQLIATRHPAAAATALELLLTGLDDAPHARALAYQLLGHARADSGDLAAAAAAFTHALESAALPPELAQDLTYDLAQIQIRRGRYQEGLGYLERWFRAAKAPDLAAHQLAAAAYVRTNRCKAAMPHLEIAARAADPSWRQALLDCQRELQRDDAADDAVRELLRRHPDSKAHWLDAIARYREGHQDREALALLEVLYRRGMAGPPELLTLARLYLAAELPNKAAALLDGELAAGHLTRERATLALLGEAWRAAQEPARAIEAYREAVAARPDGNLYVAIGELAIALERWGDAVGALDLALRQTVVRDPARANLLLGIAALRSGDLARAQTALDTAAKVLATRDAAQEWLRELAAARAAAAGPEAARAARPRG